MPKGVGPFLFSPPGFNRKIQMTEKAAALILILNCASTFALTGIVWLVQVLIYPSFKFVGRNRFREAHRTHTTSISLVVAPLMVVELVTSGIMAFVKIPGIHPWLSYFGLGLALLIWVSTFAIQVPIHNSLSGGFEERLARRLVRSNLIRASAWSARSLICIYVIWALLGSRL